MNTPVKSKMLKIFISNTDKFKNEPLHEVIIYAAKRYGLSGATAFKGSMGFGSSSGKITNLRFWEITEKIPVLVMIVDEEDKILGFIKIIKPYFEKIKNGCLITVEEVEIILHKHGTGKNSLF
jgi:uncharacterized protein